MIRVARFTCFGSNLCLLSAIHASGCITVMQCQALVCGILRVLALDQNARFNFHQKWVKPEMGIRAMRTKQVACDVPARRHPRRGRCRSLFIPASVSAILLIVRTAMEDRFLTHQLPGYQAYAAKTRWKLIPGVF